jgi:hypothetical protein
MKDNIVSIEELVGLLPIDAQQEVRDFAEFLLAKRVPQAHGALDLSWKGALRDLRSQYTSVDLQHKAAEWWGD